MIYRTRQKLTDSYQMLVWLVHRSFARQGRIMGLDGVFNTSIGLSIAIEGLQIPFPIQRRLVE